MCHQLTVDYSTRLCNDCSQVKTRGEKNTTEKNTGRKNTAQKNARKNGAKA
jgi:hypothetical protein